MTSVLIGELAKSPKLKESMTLGQKLIYLDKLKYHDVTNPDKLAKFKKFFPKAIKIAKERNRYIHDQWVFKDENIIEGKIERIKLMAIGKIESSSFLKYSDLELFLRKIGYFQKKTAALLKSFKN